MEKDRKENSFWGNPCDTTVEINIPVYDSQMPRNVASSAMATIRRMDEIKNDLAYKTLTVPLETALNDWKSYRWMEEFMSLQQQGFRDKVIHPDKRLGEVLGNLQPIMQDIDGVLPDMYKAGKMVLAGMHLLQDHVPVDDTLPGNDTLKSNFTSIVMQLKGFACEFKELIRSRHLEVKPLLDNEIPDHLENQEGIIFRLFRDTMLYLEYIREVAEAMLEYPLPPVPPK